RFYFLYFLYESAFQQFGIVPVSLIECVGDNQFLSLIHGISYFRCLLFCLGSWPETRHDLISDPAEQERSITACIVSLPFGKFRIITVFMRKAGISIFPYKIPVQADMIEYD